MRLFSFLYDKMMRWSQHPHAAYYLFGLSFIESSIFPIPPDVMLAPMTLADFKRAWWYASLTTIASVLGGILGYFLGMFFIDLAYSYIEQLGYGAAYLQVVAWFKSWGFWVIFIAGFAPIPYKLFTIAAGATGMGMLPFVIGSMIGRGGRFFLVTAAMVWGGKRVEQMLKQYIEPVGWLAVGMLVMAYYTVHYVKAN